MDGMQGLKSILLLALAAVLLGDAADCSANSAQRADDMDCCQSMPCTPANQGHDCCKNMVRQREPYLVSIAPSNAQALAAVAVAPVLEPDSMAALAVAESQNPTDVVADFSPPPIHPLLCTFLI